MPAAGATQAPLGLAVYRYALGLKKDLAHENLTKFHRFILSLLHETKTLIDTSVFGGYFDEEFSEFTRLLLKRLRNGEFRLLFSAVTQDELSSAPERVKKLVTSLRAENTEFMETNDEAVELATQYIVKKVVGQTSFADCLHIALETINRADYLISWNFKHIVNVQRIRG